jgi:hypothetical protein
VRATGRSGFSEAAELEGFKPKLLGGGTPLAALTWVFANSKVMSSGYMV